MYQVTERRNGVSLYKTKYNECIISANDEQTKRALRSPFRIKYTSREKSHKLTEKIE